MSVEYSAEVLADAPTVRLRNGEASGTVAIDSSGNDNHGTYNGGVTLGAAGMVTDDPNTSVLFNGIDSFIDLGNVAALQGITKITFECIVAIAASGGNYGFLSPNYTDGDNPFTFEYGGVSTLYLRSGHFLGCGGGCDLDSGVSIDTTPHHLVFAEEVGVSAEIYLDGVSIASRALNTTGDMDGQWFIGKRKNNSFWMSGRMQECAIYGGQLLPPARVAAHHAAMIAPGPPPAAPSARRRRGLSRAIGASLSRAFR